MFQLDRRGTVEVLKMDDGKVNAMSPAWAAAFAKVWSEVAATGRPVVIHSTARSFSAGLDLKVATQLAPHDRTAFTAAFMGAFRSVLGHPRPVVAAVNGAAMAGGAVLALCCDVRYVTDAARMGVVEVAAGVPFPEPVLSLAREKLPANEHAYAILEGGTREGADLVARGWADRHTSAVGILDQAIAHAARLGEHSALAYGDAKLQMNDRLLAAFDRFDASRWAKMWEHPDTRAALARTLEKLQRR